LNKFNILIKIIRKKIIKELTLKSVKSMRLQKMRIVCILSLLFITVSVYSQTVFVYDHFDTLDYYIPNNYPGALNYNLMIAASKGYTNDIKRLISKGADMSAETSQGVTPLIFAVSNNQTNAVKELIADGSDENKSDVNKRTSQNETPLLIAVKNQNPEIAEVLIRAGADIDATDGYNATPLHYASAYGYLDIVDLLLYYSASIDNKTSEGYTPLLASIWAGNADISDLLIQNGADTEARDNDGFTPFLMAAYNGDTLIMDLLHNKGVNIYATNLAHNNALSLSIMSDKNEAVKYLLKISDKWKSQGNKISDPYMVAVKYRRKDILHTLQEQKFPGKITYGIDQIDIMISGRFSAHDMFTGASLSFKEPYLNAGIIIGCDTKLWYSRVLLKQSEHVYYQYMSKGSVAYAGLFKDFALTNYAFKGNFVLSTSLSAGYAYGTELKGTLNVLQNQFKIIPSISLKWAKKDFAIALGADYMKSEFYRVGPVWIRLGAIYNLYFDDVRSKGKTLKWY
jgi:ankyrin repeat protein